MRDLTMTVTWHRRTKSQWLKMQELTKFAGPSSEGAVYIYSVCASCLHAWNITSHKFKPLKRWILVNWPKFLEGPKSCKFIAYTSLITKHWQCQEINTTGGVNYWSYQLFYGRVRRCLLWELRKMSVLLCLTNNNALITSVNKMSL